MANLVVVGTQWGDEGKGKLVDILAEFADMVVRFQGGANAGHTLIVDGEKLITHLVPSGILHPAKRCAIGPAVVVDPETLVEEIDTLSRRGVRVTPDVLLVSHRAHLVMPYHRQLDAAREAAKGAKKIGTTLRGIGPCLEDKAARTGIRLSDLLDSEVLAERLAAKLPELNAVLLHYGSDAVREQDILPRLAELAARLIPFVGDVGEAVRQEMDRGKNVLFEGAQGTLLDIDHGTYPFVTSSSTSAGAVCPLIGFGPGRVDGVAGVAKAYTTRVGAGPFPTEMEDERGEKLRAAGGEYGATTGRPRRCGWLDLAALRYAAAVNGLTSLCVTKLDVLGGMGPIRIGVGYRLDGRELTSPPASIREFSRVEPIYEELEGWEEDLGKVRTKEDLPSPARRYIERLAHLLHLPVDIVSVGAGRAETIMVQNPFRRT
jgi:adenylosuccinate synthase